MKLMIHIYETKQTHILPCNPTDMAYVGGGDGAGFEVDDSSLVDWEPDGEYVAVSAAMSLYEGGEASGSYRDYSFAWMPENQSDAQHLAEYACRPPIYRCDD